MAKIVKKVEITTPEEVKNTKEVVTQEIDTTKDILARLDQLESENKALKEDKKSAMTKGKERYKWPRHFSYKMWAGIPVLSYKSTKKDVTKDWSYKIWKELVSNHYLELSLVGDKKMKVEVNEFNRSFERSEKQLVTLMRDEYWEEIVGYKFNNNAHWEFIVQKQVIN